MAFSEEAFPPTIIDGEEVPHPATTRPLPRPTMRTAELPDEMFLRENLEGAHYMTLIDTAPEHHRVPREIPLEELYHDAVTAQELMAKRRDVLAQRFVAAGLPALALDITGRTHQYIEERQQGINALQDKIEQQPSY
jgi:hypothetical protein